MATLVLVLKAVEGVLFFFAAYNFLLSLSGLPAPRRERLVAPKNRFALLVPAHNEARVVAENVRSLLSLDYPRSLYRIYVIADNCTDDTAVRAREAGADAVLERFNKEKRGKGHALAWARDQVEAGWDPDAYCVFDADNVVSPNFLAVMNTKLENGAQVVQGYLDTKNPDDTWVTKAIATAYWISNRLWQLARSNLKLGNALGGTGYCVRSNTLRQYEPDPECLTDDLELQMRLLVAGIRVEWAHTAVTYDEKPLTMKASWRQRVRWMQGHWDVTKRFTVPLLTGAIRDRSWAKFDGAIYCIQPSRTAVAGLAGLIVLVKTGVPSIAYDLKHSFHIPVGAWSILLVSYFGYPILAMYLEGVPKRMYARYGYSILFALTWIPITVIGVLRSHKKEWVHTQHTRSIGIPGVRTSRVDEVAPMVPVAELAESQQSQVG
jgi:cellulose synthase/poly-beta-1,6-N-acetylglucosamine synthase-like glycosyltransferase